MRILKGLGSRSLACGCLVGLYETYDSQTVAILDAKGSSCSDAAHRMDSPIDLNILNAAPAFAPEGGATAGKPNAPAFAPESGATAGKPVQPPNTIPTRNR